MSNVTRKMACYFGPFLFSVSSKGYLFIFFEKVVLAALLIKNLAPQKEYKKKKKIKNLENQTKRKDIISSGTDSIQTNKGKKSLALWAKI